MIVLNRDPDHACLQWQDAIQERLDARPAGDPRSELDAHLAWCSDCREFEESLLAIRSALSSLPEIPFPDDALGPLWAAAQRRGRSLPHRAPAWRGLAAAAVVALALIGTWNASTTSADAELRLELQRVAIEARPALRILGRAFERIEQATVNEVLVGPLVRAVRSIPIKWTPSSQ